MFSLDTFDYKYDLPLGFHHSEVLIEKKNKFQKSKMKLLESVLVGTISATTAPPMETTAPAISSAEYSLDAIRM